MSKPRRVRILIKIICLAFVLSSLVFAGRAFSYDTHIAHPNIVTIAALEYNKMYDPDLTEEEIGWLSDGAVDEDMPTRWLNHFYDPIYNKGLNNGKYPTAKDWSRMTNYQTTFAMGDKTWYRAIDYFQKGDKKKAFIALGHILHLIADMSVPAHTRDDAHPTGDSYEQFVKNNWTQISKQINSFEKKQISSLDNVFDVLAKYSNGNFYSDDTVKSGKYDLIDISEKKTAKDAKGDYYIYNFKDGYKVFGSEDDLDWQLRLKNKRHKGNFVDDQYILTDYSKQLLSPASSYTIATIDLFFKEAAKEQNVKLSKNKISLLGAADYLLGTVINKAENLYNLFKGKDKSLVVASDSPQIAASADDSPQIVDADNTDADKTQSVASTRQNTDLSAEAPAEADNMTQSITNPTPNTDNLTQTTIAEELVLEKVVKVEKPKEAVSLPNPPSPAPVVKPIVYSYGGGVHSGGGGGGGGGSSPTPDANNLTQTTTPAVEAYGLTAGQATSTPEQTATTTVDVAEVAVATSTPDLVVTSTPGQVVTTIEETVTTTPDMIQNADLSAEASAEADNTTQTTTTTESMVTSTPITDVLITNDSSTSTEQTPTSTPAVETFGLTAGQATSTLEEMATSTPPIIEIPPPAVVINEIAWAGTASIKSSDEWIELHSNATSSVDLTDWKILVGDKEIKLSGAIGAGGYYLLERSKDKTVVDIDADKIFTLANGLKNDGARLRLVDGAGETVDEVDCSSGWFAGDNVKYRSMARKSATASGNEQGNWFSSLGVAVRGRADGGSVIYGSPGFTNHGHWLLKSLVTYYSGLFDENNTLTLTSENNPYVIDYVTAIPAGYTLKIEPGVVLVGIEKSAYFSIAGNLVVEGAAEAPVVFTSALDTNYVQTSLTNLTGTAGPGDWSRIQVESGGNFTGSFVKFLYGGRTFKKSPGAMFTTHFYSNVIHNYGGSVSLDNAEFSYNYFDSGEDREEYSALIYVEAPLDYDASLAVSNSSFNGGWRAIKSFRQDNGQTIEIDLANNAFRDFQSPGGLITSRRDFVNLSDGAFENNASDAVHVEMWTLAQDYSFKTGTQYSFNNIFVPTDAVLAIDPGVRIKLAKQGSIIIEGSIQANGTPEQPIVFESQNPGEKWGYVKCRNSDSVFNHVDFIGGNLTAQGDVNTRAVIVAENSTLELGSVSITDSRAPGNAIYSFNSNLNINNSTIGNAEEPGFEMTGIKAEGGAIILDDVVLQNLKFGIRGDFDDAGLLPHLELNNMSESNFVNVDYLWEPNTWLSPAE